MSHRPAPTPWGCRTSARPLNQQVRGQYAAPKRQPGRPTQKIAVKLDSDQGASTSANEGPRRTASVADATWHRLPTGSHVGHGGRYGEEPRPRRESTSRAKPRASAADAAVKKPGERTLSAPRECKTREREKRCFRRGQSTSQRR